MCGRDQEDPHLSSEPWVCDNCQAGGSAQNNFSLSEAMVSVFSSLDKEQWLVYSEQSELAAQAVRWPALIYKTPAS